MFKETEGTKELIVLYNLRKLQLFIRNLLFMTYCCTYVLCAIETMPLNYVKCTFFAFYTVACLLNIYFMIGLQNIFNMDNSYFLHIFTYERYRTNVVCKLLNFCAGISLFCF